MRATFVKYGSILMVEDVRVGLAALGADFVHRAHPFGVQVGRIGQEEDACTGLSVVEEREGAVVHDGEVLLLHARSAS